MILSSGATLALHELFHGPPRMGQPSSQPTVAREANRDHIMHVLEECGVP
jgi:hypothetical protein